jgi:hypothetical protein
MENKKLPIQVICSFCEFSFNHDDVTDKKLKFKKFMENEDELTTLKNYAISRCAKCRKCFSCNICLGNMSTHYFRCQGKKEINAFIFHDLNCPMPEFNFLVLPDSLGGGVVNLKHQFSLRDATIFHFHETKYALVEIKESGLTGWFLNTDKIISALKQTLHRSH